MANRFDNMNPRFCERVLETVEQMGGLETDGSREGLRHVAHALGVPTGQLRRAVRLLCKSGELTQENGQLVSCRA